MVWLVSISSDTMDSIKRFDELYEENQELDKLYNCRTPINFKSIELDTVAYFVTQQQLSVT